jgi:phospholipase C
MDGFVTAHLASDGVAGQYTMAYFQRADVPFHWALADAFTICDGYHCSMLGPTWPNRLYLMTGQVDPAGVAGGPVYGNYVPPQGYSWKTYPEMLTSAGVSWKIYQEADNYGMNVMEYFDQYQNAPTSSPLYQNAMRFYQAGQFEHDAINDRLPTVSWIIPTSYQSEHPDYMPAAGADFVASKINAIASNPDVFAKTVFILIYDENDGYFDHVTPPTPPAGTAGEFITVDNVSDPIGLGFRVPCVIVSPWTVGGLVCHDTFDHTSVIRLIETVTGVVNPNLTQWRRKAVSDLTSALGPIPNRRFPRLPQTVAELEAAENQVVRFQPPAIPGASQSFPVQPTPAEAKRFADRTNHVPFGRNKIFHAERSVVRALPVSLQAGREAVEQELHAELEALVAVGDDGVGHRGDDREPVGGQPAEVVPDRAEVLLHLEALPDLDRVQRALVDVRVDVDLQPVDGPGRQLVGEPGRPQDGQQALDHAQAIRAGGDRGERGPGDVRVPGPDPLGLPGVRPELILPAGRIRLGDLDLARDPVDHQLEQLVAAGHVRVQRRRSRAEILGDPPGADRVQAVPVEDRDRRGDDPLPGQRLLDRPAAARLLPRQGGHLGGFHGSSIAERRS